MRPLVQVASVSAVNEVPMGDSRTERDESLVATFTINLTFSPQTIDPDFISRRLGLEPTFKWRAGERTRDVHGALFAYRQRKSRWSLITSYYDRREDDLDPWNETRDALGPRLDDRLTVFLAPFVQERSFVREVVADSRDPWLGLNFPGQFHFGCLILPGTLRSISDLGLELGIEIFPNTAS